MIPQKPSSTVFRWQRVGTATEIPEADPRVIDVALLDMHHSWPNLGHDALVSAVAEIAEDLRPLLEPADLSMRVLSYDVRRGLRVPEHSGGRHRVYIGTGGPGHIDPRMNDGVAEFSQGVCEDPGWEPRLYRLLDAILADPVAAMIAVCHTFGVMCRWSGVARPVLRGIRKGGKSSGVRDNVLSAAGARHPWFSRFSAELRDGRHFRVLDNRLFDLVAEPGSLPKGVVAVAFEATGSGEEGEALTMAEFAADCGGVMPRVFAVNHHPEIRNRRRQRWLLERKLERGEVTRQWYDERVRTLGEAFSSREVESDLMLTSQYTLVAPLRFHVYREVRRRAESFKCRTALHEDQVLRLRSGTLERESSTSSADY